MAWTLRWPRSRSGERVVLTVGSAGATHRVGLTIKDIWRLRQGSTVLRDGLLIVPEEGKLRFLLAGPSLEPEQRQVQVLDESVLG